MDVTAGVGGVAPIGAKSGDLRFAGRIAGFGTASGTRIVIGLWESSPFGRFADVMLEDAEGHRMLLAPTGEVAAFVSATYTFDEVRVAPVGVRRIEGGLAVRAGVGATSGAPVAGAGAAGASSAGSAGSGAEDFAVAGAGLAVRLRVGAVSPLGRVLRSLPTALTTSPAWLAAVDPLAKALVPGVSTAGSAGGGRREFYGVTRVRRIAWASAAIGGRDLGAFAPLDPPVRFGFGSAPSEPSLVDLVTTIRMPS